MPNLILIKITNGYIISYTSSNGQLSYYQKTLEDVILFIAQHYQDHDYVNQLMLSRDKDELDTGVSDTLPS